MYAAAYDAGYRVEVDSGFTEAYSDEVAGRVNLYLTPSAGEPPACYQAGYAYEVADYYGNYSRAVCHASPHYESAG